MPFTAPRLFLGPWNISLGNAKGRDAKGRWVSDKVNHRRNGLFKSVCRQVARLELRKDHHRLESLDDLRIKMTATEQLKVIIVGAGFGGLGAAIECADRGMDVTVIEKYPDSNSQGGK